MISDHARWIEIHVHTSVLFQGGMGRWTFHFFGEFVSIQTICQAAQTIILWNRFTLFDRDYNKKRILLTFLDGDVWGANPVLFYHLWHQVCYITSVSPTLVIISSKSFIFSGESHTSHFSHNSACDRQLFRIALLFLYKILNLLRVIWNFQQRRVHCPRGDDGLASELPQPLWPGGGGRGWDQGSFKIISYSSVLNFSFSASM